MAATCLLLRFAPGDYYFEQPWTLSGVTYLFTVRYNTRANTWFLDMADATGQAIVCGIALRGQRDLLAPYRAKNVPSGTLFVYDRSGNNTDPGLDGFALDHGLYYYAETA